MKINAEIRDDEVPKLRQSVGGGTREYEYPASLQRCHFYDSVRSTKGKLIGFGFSFDGVRVWIS